MHTLRARPQTRAVAAPAAPAHAPASPRAGATSEVTQLRQLLNHGPRARALHDTARTLQRVPATAPSVIQRVGGQTTGYDPDAITKPAFKIDVERLFEVARRVNRLRKQGVTKRNTDALGVLPEADKGSQVKDRYAPELAEINLDVDWLTAVLTDGARVHLLLTQARATGFIDDPGVTQIEQTIAELRTRLQIADGHVVDLTWKDADGGARPRAKLLVGAAAFAPLAGADPARGLHRPTYKKLGKAGAEYVQDDLGTYTRRYAYMEKSYHQVMAYKETGALTGKTQDLWGAATATTPTQVNPLDFGSQHLTRAERDLVAGQGPDPAAPMRTLAYMHQWKGSGPGQRGLSLTSTPKDDAVYGNAGDAFRTADGAKFTIDLAKVNPADNLLINHYSASSPTRTALPGDARLADRRLGATAKWDGYQYERSVIKNREVYLQQMTATMATLQANQAGLDVDMASAAFLTHKRGAQRARLLTLKAEFEAALQRATLDRTREEAARVAAQDAATAAATERNKVTGKFGAKVRLPDGRRVNAFKHWKAVAQDKQAEADAAAQRVRDGDALIARLGVDVAACQRQLDLLVGALPAAPGADVHATSGWGSGSSWADGFKEGLAAKARGGSAKDKVSAMFTAAYDPANETKFSPYWQGFGRGLNS